jgi:hypothetical protein
MEGMDVHCAHALEPLANVATIAPASIRPLRLVRLGGRLDDTSALALRALVRFRI